MQYTVKGLLVKSENAAKPRAQKSHYLESLIRSVRQCHSGLDYGCGKLRYFPALREVCRKLVLVDSAIQLGRMQTLGGRRTTIRRYISRWPAVAAMDVEHFIEDEGTFDLILCSNVLSAIPSRKVRLLMVETLASRLRKGGRALFAVQYTNSYFTALRNDPRAQEFLDGYLVSSSRGNSFYGIITPECLSKLLTKGGFRTQHLWRAGQSAYAWAQRS